MNDLIKKAAEIIRQSDAIFITAGAGMGVDSGLPDFRGTQGFWKAYPPIAKLGYRFEEMANPVWFEENPQLAWAFYGHRLNLYRKTKPHYGFDILLEIGQQKPFGYFVFTSNVDGQFQKAGFDENMIYEVHGSIHHLQCSIPCKRDIWYAQGMEIKIDEENFLAKEPLPVCPHCGAIARPNILMFGDWNWIADRSAKQSQKMNLWFAELKKNKAKIAIIEIGAGTAVPTVRHQSERIMYSYNATLIRINPREPEVPPGQIGIAAGALDTLNYIYEKLQKF